MLTRYPHSAHTISATPGRAALSSTRPIWRLHAEAISNSRSRLPAAPRPGVHGDRLFAWRVLFAIAGNGQQQVALSPVSGSNPCGVVDLMSALKRSLAESGETARKRTRKAAGDRRCGRSEADVAARREEALIEPDHLSARTKGLI